MHARDPRGILKQIFRLFLKKGGKFIQTEIKSLEQKNINETIIKSESQEYKFEKSVVSSGAHSKKLTDQLGENIPLDTEEATMFTLRIKNIYYQDLLFLDRGFGMTSMNQGLRAVGTVELGGLKTLHHKKE